MQQSMLLQYLQNAAQSLPWLSFAYTDTGDLFFRPTLTRAAEVQKPVE